MKFNMEKAYNKGSHFVFDEIAYNPSSRPGGVVQSGSVKWIVHPGFDVYIFSILTRFSLFLTSGCVVNWLNI